MVKMVTVFCLVFSSLLFSLLSVFAITGEVITGEATQSNFNVSVSVVGAFTINITSPENDTYLFNAGSNYTIDLNVTTLENVYNWWYTLENSTGIVNNSVIFVPNGTLYSVVGYNRLTVTANSTSGALATDSVVFSVTVNNTAPILGFISPEILVCEGESLFYTFNFTDNEGGNLVASLSNTNPFYVYNPPSPSFGSVYLSEIFSGDVLAKSHARGNTIYSQNVSVTDGTYSDSTLTNITVIEINNEPSVETLGAKTVWAYGNENRTFYEVVNVSDLEYGNESSGNFSFNLTFNNSVTPFFNISQFGVINFTANESYLGANNASKVYNLSLCVTDLGLLNPHVNISSECDVDGSNNTVCQQWTLTVTAQNREPRIESYYPADLNFNASGSSTLNFNVSVIDPDGTYPDARWYVNGALSETDTGSLNNYYSYAIPCGVSGDYSFLVNASDGLLSDNLEWNVSVSSVACPVLSPGGGGSNGGGGSGLVCTPKWACENWFNCQLVSLGLESKKLEGEDYREIFSVCEAEEWGDEECGYQIRTCRDANNCNRTTAMPELVQSCYYTENPTCSDGIKNCHDDSCEVLVDCGGPCKACSTCSDGVQNQGELGVDCGGPCPGVCLAETPSVGSFFGNLADLATGKTNLKGFLVLMKDRRNLAPFFSLVTLLVLIVVLVIKLYQIFMLKRKNKSSRL